MENKISIDSKKDKNIELSKKSELPKWMLILKQALKEHLENEQPIK